MKALVQIFSLSFIFSLASLQVAGQEECRVLLDSVTIGPDAGNYKDYIYNTQGRLTQVIHRVGSSEYAADVITYDGGTDLIATIKSVDLNDTSRHQDIEYEISAGRIVRINASRDSAGVRLWAISHDVSYTGANLSSIVIDQGSIEGSPEFPGSFTDITWDGENIVSLSLVLGPDEIPLAVTHDAANNINKKLPNTDGAPGLLMSASANNILTIAATAAGSIGGRPVDSGEALIDMAYTYNSNNDVETSREKVAFFNGNDRTTKFTYSCISFIKPLINAREVILYPNPASDFISIENGYFTGTVKIFDIAGKKVNSVEIKENRSFINISDLTPGVYYVEVNDGEKILQGKVLKK